MGKAYIDPFGAPEVRVNEIGARELIGDYVLLPWCLTENDPPERILKVKLFVPLRVLLLERDKTDAFLAGLSPAVTKLRLM